MKYIYYALLLSGLGILILRRPRLDKRLYLFIPLLFFTIVTELISDLKEAYFLYHINQAIGCTLLCTYYFLLFPTSRYRNLILLSLVLYLTYFTGFFIRHPSQFVNFDPVDFVAEGVLITLFSLYYLIDLSMNSGDVHYRRLPHFWIASGNLLFYSGASLFMAFAFQLRTTNPALYTELSYIAYFLNLVVYSAYIKAFLCHLPEKTLS
ncbi:MAG TPA: hypothetical protein VGM31_07380 [Puia sp.]